MGATGCMQIQEIVTTGKLSKLEHFETDEKVFWIFLMKLHSHMALTFFCSIYILLHADGVLLTFITFILLLWTLSINNFQVRTISLFVEVWGIGPATALKIYEKGHRTLEDLKNEDSLTHSQKLGLKYFDDIKTRIPRHEVRYPACSYDL